MKKVISGLLILSMLFTVACGKSDLPESDAGIEAPPSAIEVQPVINEPETPEDDSESSEPEETPQITNEEIILVAKHRVRINGVGSFPSFRMECYFVTNKETREVIIIDPGGEADMLMQMLKENGLKPVAILLTHSHYDHIGAAEELRTAFDIPVYAWIDEKDYFGDSYYDFDESFNGNIVANNITWLDDEDTPLEIAGFSVRAIHTPGHTAGSACYYIESESILFSGDTMYRLSSTAINANTGGDNSALIDTYLNKLYTLPDETRIYPGHGDNTNIGFEKENNSMNLNWLISIMSVENEELIVE